jgi:hypothetical protein
MFYDKQVKAVLGDSYYSLTNLACDDFTLKYPPSIQVGLPKWVQNMFFCSWDPSIMARHRLMAAQILACLLTDMLCAGYCRVPAHLPILLVY